MKKKIFNAMIIAILTTGALYAMVTYEYMEVTSCSGKGNVVC